MKKFLANNLETFIDFFVRKATPLPNCLARKLLPQQSNNKISVLVVAYQNIEAEGGMHISIIFFYTSLEIKYIQESPGLAVRA